MRIAFLGTPEFALPIVEACTRAGELVLVVAQPDKPVGRHQQLQAPATKQWALQHGVRVEQPDKVKQGRLAAVLASARPDVAVVAAYGRILPPDALGVPAHGSLNVHASLLPELRGAAPAQWAVARQYRETGVTIMQMDEGLDTGPVLLQRRLALSASHTSGSLHEALSTLGAAALLTALDGLSGGLAPRPQPSEGVTYAPRIEKAEARIDWSRDALEIERQVRAFNPWPVAETALEGEPLRILAAQAEPGDKSADPGAIISVHDDFMRVRCGRGCLRVTEVQRPGRRRLAVRDYSHSVALTGRQLG